MANYGLLQLLACLLWICLAQGKLGLNPRPVPDLAPSDIASFVRSHEKVLITFCSPYGAHCRRMAPDIVAAQELLRETDIRLANVDCIEHSDYCNIENIRAYPTLRIYESNLDSYETFPGRKSEKELVTYLMFGSWPTATTEAPKPTHTYVKPVKPEPPNPSPNASASNLVYLQKDGVGATVKLELPGLPIKSPTVPDELSRSSSIILEFNFTDDGKHVILNSELLALQVPNPSIPALISAKQVPIDYDIWDMHRSHDNSRWAQGEFRTLGIDYEMFSRSRDDPNIRYYNYYPELVINIIGCSSPDPESYQTDFILDSLEQKVVKIVFEDVQGSRQSEDPKRSYRVKESTFHERSDESGYRRAPTRPEFEGYRVPRPDDRPCSRWSWRCADIGDPPWYRYIWRQNFDEYGRIGCLRWSVSRQWHLILQPALNNVIAPIWVWLPLLVITLFFRLVRPLLQRMANEREGDKRSAKD